MVIDLFSDPHIHLGGKLFTEKWQRRNFHFILFVFMNQTKEKGEIKLKNEEP